MRWPSCKGIATMVAYHCPPHPTVSRLPPMPPMFIHIPIHVPPCPSYPQPTHPYTSLPINISPSISPTGPPMIYLGPVLRPTLPNHILKPRERPRRRALLPPRPLRGRPGMASGSGDEAVVEETEITARDLEMTAVDRAMLALQTVDGGGQDGQRYADDDDDDDIPTRTTTTTTTRDRRCRREGVRCDRRRWRSNKRRWHGSTT